mmetsp:Transcript_81568/g.243204  ORF Transcript_81568/g.243204 Transcript_81568/m.243204 type:complete len:225 (+) Transcript_81568:66-740(+)
MVCSLAVCTAPLNLWQGWQHAGASHVPGGPFLLRAGRARLLPGALRGGGHGRFRQDQRRAGGALLVCQRPGEEGPEADLGHRGQRHARGAGAGGVLRGLPAHSPRAGRPADLKGPGLPGAARPSTLRFPRRRGRRTGPAGAGAAAGCTATWPLSASRGGPAAPQCQGPQEVRAPVLCKDHPEWGGNDGCSRSQGPLRAIWPRQRRVAAGLVLGRPRQRRALELA